MNDWHEVDRTENAQPDPGSNPEEDVVIRRVITGNKGGKAVVVSDETPARTHEFEHATGLGWSFAWATPSAAKLSATEAAEAVTRDTTIIPRQGETRFLFLRVPPDSYAMREDFDPMAAGGEMAAHMPDMVAAMEPDNPGMHRTDSIDYVIVLDGEVYLELDDQEEVHLREHDVVIQGGTRHAWRNKSDKAALLAVVLVGAERDVD
jgi:hypothetical protein